jgi:phosphoglycolate phosphatase-like HAD superfamily hydrolase
LPKNISENINEKEIYTYFDGLGHMMRRAYLFDFDGTLVDTMQGFADIAADVISTHHPEISFDEARRKYLETSGNPFFKQLEMILPGDPLNSKMSANFEERKIDGFFKSSFSDDVRYTIESLRARGDIAGVASNNFQELIDRFVEREGLVFDIVLGFREGFEKGKQHFDFVIDRFSLERSDLTFVGDSLKDAEKAFDNNLQFVGICGTFNRDDFREIRSDIVTINSIKEILTL